MAAVYPKHKYAPSGGSVWVTDAAHERALGPGWLDNPQVQRVAPAEPPADVEEEAKRTADEPESVPQPVAVERVAAAPPPVVPAAAVVRPKKVPAPATRKPAPRKKAAK